MVSSKVKKYMKQYEERNYAPKIRKLEKNDLKKYCNGSESRQASEASCCDSLQQSREIEEEVILTEEIVYTGEENEEWRKEESAETSKRGQKGIQGTNKRRSKISKIIEQKEI